MSNNKCTCGQVETAIHLLLHCPIYKEERSVLLKRVKEVVRVRQLTLPLLLHTKVGISNLLVFLKETSIATRKWYIEREQLLELEEEEEEEEEVEGEEEEEA